MTEHEWRELTDPMAMLAILRSLGKLKPRKARLFAVACSRRIWHVLDESSHHAVLTAEQFADGKVHSDALRDARLACKTAGNNASWYAAASQAEIAARNAAWSAQSGSAGDGERLAHAHLIRDIFGNPFRPMTLHPSWITSTVLELGRSIYAERGWDRMQILADALLDAGCDKEEIVSHCRGEGPHVRGCWVVDLLLAEQ